MGARNLGYQQNQRKSNLAKLRKTKPRTPKRKLLTVAQRRSTESGISTKSAPNQSSKVEKIKTTDTEERTPNLLRKVGGKEPGIATKLTQHQSSKVGKNKTTDTEDKTPNPVRKDGARNLGSQQNPSQTNLAKLRKTKLRTQKRNLLT